MHAMTLLIQNNKRHWPNSQRRHMSRSVRFCIGLYTSSCMVCPLLFLCCACVYVPRVCLSLSLCFCVSTYMYIYIYICMSLCVSLVHLCLGVPAYVAVSVHLSFSVCHMSLTDIHIIEYTYITCTYTICSLHVSLALIYIFLFVCRSLNLSFPYIPSPACSFYYIYSSLPFSSIRPSVYLLSLSFDQ